MRKIKIFCKAYIVLLAIVLLLGSGIKSILAQTSQKYVPLIGITMVPDPRTLPAGPGTVTYNYAVKNFLSDIALDEVKVVDDHCSPVTFSEGDDDNDFFLDFNETWRYKCTTQVSATVNSVATATGVANNLTATHKAYATVVVGSKNASPMISIVNVTKVAYPLSLPTEGGRITYTYKVNNPGIMPLSNVSVKDDKCSAVSNRLGDTNGNAVLDINEVWTYTCATLLKETTTSTVTVTAYAEGIKTVSSANLTVTVETSPDPVPDLPETGENPNLKIIVWTSLAGVVIALLLSWIFKKRRKNNA